MEINIRSANKVVWKEYQCSH